MPTIVEYLSDEQLAFGLVTEQEKNKITIVDSRGRQGKIVPDKVLFRHVAGSIEELTAKIENLQSELDIPLLWESLQAEGDCSPREAAELAQLYFDSSNDTYNSAVYRALSQERLHFRRRGRAFEPRSAEDIQKLREQQLSMSRAVQELQELEDALNQRTIDSALGNRLERYLRTGEDRTLHKALETIASQPMPLAFNLLLEANYLPKTADLEILQANLQIEHPAPVTAFANAITPISTGAVIERSAFSIDDPETREVDDAISIYAEGDLLHIDIDIADAAAWVAPGDPIDREAFRRATTVYLPTGIYYMLPEAIGCNLASLDVAQVRPSFRTSVWLDQKGAIQRYKIYRTMVQVEERLDYDTADELLAHGQGPTAEALRLLKDISERLALHRQARGAVSFRRPEWKIRVSPEAEEIAVKLIVTDSPSRALVAEMMILTNHLLAQWAAENNVPIIYRTQSPPIEPLPENQDPADPALFIKLRRFIQPATLSLFPAQHWGLGLESYTQITSPLRRYGDLVLQRQIGAALAKEPLPYNQEDLLKVLATVEATEKEMKRVEAAVTSHWALEYVSRLKDKSGLQGKVIGEAAGGYRVELELCGAQGILLDERLHQIGEQVLVNIKSVKPREGVLRLVP